MTAKEKCDLRLDIYFKLTNAQQRKFNANYSWHFIEEVPMSAFIKITKNRDLISKLGKLKRACIRLAS